MVQPVILEELPEELSTEEILELQSVTRSDTAQDGTPANAGWLYCWNTLTGERVSINRSSLRSQMQKKRPDGQSAFVFQDPHIEPVAYQTHYCLLSKHSPMRPIADEYGFAFCEKKLRTPLHVRRHMEHRHADENNTFTEIRTERERLEQRSWQTSLIELAQNREVTEIKPGVVAAPHLHPEPIAESPPVVVPTTFVETISTTDSTILQGGGSGVAPCLEPRCSFLAKGKTDRKRRDSLMKHTYGPHSKHQKTPEVVND